MQANTNMAEKNRKSNRNFNIEKPIKRQFEIEKEKIGVPFSPPGQQNNNDDQNNKSSKPNKGKIIGIVLVIIALLAFVFFWWIKGNNNGTDSTEVDSTKINAQMDTHSQDSIAQDVANTKDESTISNEQVTVNNQSEASVAVDDKSSLPLAKDDPSSLGTMPHQPKPQSTSSNIHSSSAIVCGDVEQDARRVIRGEFGVGRVRKDALGTHYEEVQTRVNEIYREKGLL